MANPQPDEYTPISNELLEAMIQTSFSDYESRIVLAVIRKTYGWEKKWDRISYSQFQKMTKIKARANISRTIKKLMNRNILQRKSLGEYKGFEMRLQKDYEQWDKRQQLSLQSTDIQQDNSTLNKEQLSKQIIVSQTDRQLLSPQLTEQLSPQLTTREKKETIQKKGTDSLYGSTPESDKLANLFLELSKQEPKRIKLYQWSDSIYKLHRIDKYEYDEIEKVIRWVLRDDFWFKNCQTPLKFRSNNKEKVKYFEVYKMQMRPITNNDFQYEPPKGNVELD